MAEQYGGDRRDLTKTPEPELFDLIKIDGQWAQVTGQDAVTFMSKLQPPVQDPRDYSMPRHLKTEKIVWQNYHFTPSPYKNLKELVDYDSDGTQFTDHNLFELAYPNPNPDDTAFAAEQRLVLKIFGEYEIKN